MSSSVCPSAGSIFQHNPDQVMVTLLLQHCPSSVPVKKIALSHCSPSEKKLKKDAQDTASTEDLKFLARQSVRLNLH